VVGSVHPGGSTRRPRTCGNTGPSGKRRRRRPSIARVGARSGRSLPPWRRSRSAARPIESGGDANRRRDAQALASHRSDRKKRRDGARSGDRLLGCDRARAPRRDANGARRGGIARAPNRADHDPYDPSHAAGASGSICATGSSSLPLLSASNSLLPPSRSF
jgi:hypothetical protein